MAVSKLESVVLGLVAVAKTGLCQKRIGSAAVRTGPSASPPYAPSLRNDMQPNDNQPDMPRHGQESLEHAAIRAGRLVRALGALTTTRSSVTTAWPFALTGRSDAAGLAWPGGIRAGALGGRGCGRLDGSEAARFLPRSKRPIRQELAAFRPCQADTTPDAGTFTASTRGERKRCGG
jgi:hypothetical protein